MTASEIPQDAALCLQLAMIRGQEPPGALLELRYRRPGGTLRRLGFYDAQDTDRVCAEIGAIASVADVWVGAAPRSRADGTRNGVDGGWCVWADIDGLEGLRRLASFRPRPSIVIATGSDHSVHAYWPLRERLAPDKLQRANRRLALALRADMKATDAARILRPAGTLNFKHEPPRPVRCVRLETDVHTAAEVVGTLPDSHHYTRPARSASAPVPVHPERVVDGLARTVRGAQVGHRNARLFWAVCRVAEHGDSLDREGALQALRGAASDVGLPEHEIEATIRSGLASARQAA